VDGIIGGGGEKKMREHKEKDLLGAGGGRRGRADLWEKLFFSERGGC